MMVDGRPKRVGVILCIVHVVGDLMIITNRDHSVNFGFEWKFDSELLFHKILKSM